MKDNVQICVYKTAPGENPMDFLKATRYYAEGVNIPILEDTGSIDELARRVAGVMFDLPRANKNTDILVVGSPVPEKDGKGYIPLTTPDVDAFYDLLKTNYQSLFKPARKFDSGSFFEQQLAKGTDPRETFDPNSL